MQHAHQQPTKNPKPSSLWKHTFWLVQNYQGQVLEAFSVALVATCSGQVPDDFSRLNTISVYLPSQFVAQSASAQ